MSCPVIHNSCRIISGALQLHMNTIQGASIPFLHAKDRRHIVKVLLCVCVYAHGAQICRGIEKLDINTVTYDELVSVFKIKPERARLIIGYRDTHGPYASIEDLQRVVSPNYVDTIDAELVVSDNLRCWSCGKIFSESMRHKTGVCPYCRKKWPAAPSDIEPREISIPENELEIKIGDPITKVIDLMGEPKRKGLSPMGALEGERKEFFGLQSYPYPSKGLTFHIVRDRIWKIEAKERYGGMLMGIHIGSTKADVIQKHGQDYHGEVMMIYDKRPTCQMQFNVDKVSQKVTQIRIWDKSISDRYSKKARRVYKREYR